MGKLLRFPSSVKRDPAIAAWMREHPDELGAIAQRWFELMRGCGSDVRELLHDGHPTACVGDAAFAYVNAFRYHVNVGFFRGAEIADPDGVLEGTGKFMRHVKLGPRHPADETALNGLVKAAYADMKERLEAEQSQGAHADRQPRHEQLKVHLGYVPGCIGRIAQMHAEFYSAHAGFGADFEAKVAKELSGFCLDYSEGRDGLWLAMDGGRIEGSIAIDGSNHIDEGAHLRWFIASERARGTGIGTQLLAAALAFCAGKSYGKIYLWTFDELPAARHLYEKHGFHLVRTQRGAQWGREVNEQLFIRDEA